MATVGDPFSIRETVRVEQVALSATCAIVKLRLRRASLICSPTICIFCSNFRGNFVPIVFLAISFNLSYNSQMYTISIFNDRLHIIHNQNNTRDYVSFLGHLEGLPAHHHFSDSYRCQFQLKPSKMKGRASYLCLSCLRVS